MAYSNIDAVSDLDCILRGEEISPWNLASLFTFVERNKPEYPSISMQLANWLKQKPEHYLYHVSN